MKFALNKKTEKKPRNSGNSTGHESPMDVTLLERLVKLMAAHDLNTVDVRDGDKRVILKRGAPVASGNQLFTPLDESMGSSERGSLGLAVQDSPTGRTVRRFSMAALHLPSHDVLATLWAPREAEHTIRPIPTGDVNQPRALEILEWVVRLGILLIGALALGSGLSGDASLLSKLVGGEVLAEAWKAKPNGVWLQLLGVLTGLAIVVVAAWPRLAPRSCVR